MNKSELEKTINILEQIREILLKDGISSEVADTTLQKICNQIDALYGELLEAMQGRAR